MLLTEITITKLPPTGRLDSLGDHTGLADDEPLEPTDDTVAVPEMPENPNKAGVIRVVQGAHLVYKRSQPDGTFSELWMYKVDDAKLSFKIRNNILSGTDIELKRRQSDDGSQSCEMWSAGNTILLYITGLPN